MSHHLTAFDPFPSTPHLPSFSQQLIIDKSWEKIVGLEAGALYSLLLTLSVFQSYTKLTGEALAQQRGCSLPTLNRHLDVLEKEGFIHRNTYSRPRAKGGKVRHIICAHYFYLYWGYYLSHDRISEEAQSRFFLDSARCMEQLKEHYGGDLEAFKSTYATHHLEFCAKQHQKKMEEASKGQKCPVDNLPPKIVSTYQKRYMDQEPTKILSMYQKRYVDREPPKILSMYQKRYNHPCIKNDTWVRNYKDFKEFFIKGQARPCLGYQDFSSLPEPQQKHIFIEYFAKKGATAEQFEYGWAQWKEFPDSFASALKVPAAAYARAKSGDGRINVEEAKTTRVESHKQLAKDAEIAYSQAQPKPRRRVHVGPKMLEFISDEGQCTPSCFEYSDINFLSRVQAEFRKDKVRVRGCST